MTALDPRRERVLAWLADRANDYDAMAAQCRELIVLLSDATEPNVQALHMGKPSTPDDNRSMRAT